MPERIASSKLVATMQFLLSLLFTVGFFAVMILVMFGRADIPPEQIRLADTLFGVLSAVLVQQSGYWFSRHRSTADPDIGYTPTQRLRDEPGTVINNYNAELNQNRGNRLEPRRPKN